MEDRFNTIAGWVLGAGIVALGGALLSSELFKHHPVKKGGYAVAEAEVSSGGAKAAAPIDWTTADVAKGEEMFKQCSACHSIEQGGANGTGPNLWATLGKPVAGHAGYTYSDALKGKGGSWTFQEMDAWLLNPKKYAAGTKMTYSGITDNVKRASVIAYLNSKGSNLPIPANAPVATDTAAAPVADGAAAAPAAAAPASPAK